jgi:hypothetical protein
MSDYILKYIKYKTKYLNLLHQLDNKSLIINDLIGGKKEVNKNIINIK